MFHKAILQIRYEFVLWQGQSAEIFLICIFYICIAGLARFLEKDLDILLLVIMCSGLCYRWFDNDIAYMSQLYLRDKNFYGLIIARFLIKLCLVIMPLALCFMKHYAKSCLSIVSFSSICMTINSISTGNKYGVHLCAFLSIPFVIPVLLMFEMGTVTECAKLTCFFLPVCLLFTNIALKEAVLISR